MNVNDKIKRIVSRNPELKETLINLEENDKLRKLFTTIVEDNPNKIIIIGRNSQLIARLYELSSILNRGYIHITELTTLDLLDIYLSNIDPEELRFNSLTQVVDDLVLIKDSNAYLPNKQKSNMITQVFEQNTNLIYYYQGTKQTFTKEHPTLLQFAKENGIQTKVLT